MLKAKIKAAFFHASVTLIVATVTAAVVFGVWYPGALAEMTRGLGLYFLLLGVEVVLGPAMSLVIFNTSKPTTELVMDYSIVGFIQLMALAFGLYSVAISRPVYLVFVKDRIEVVAAAELAPSDLEAAAEGFRTLPWLGPRLICVEHPVNPQEKSDVLLSALDGKDIQLLPKYYRACRQGEIAVGVYSKNELFSLTQIKPEMLSDELKSTNFGWLPVVTRFGAWTAIYKGRNFETPHYLNIDPFQRNDPVRRGGITPPASTDQ